MTTQSNTNARPVADINHVILVGRSGKDSEIRYLESGKVVTSFSLAVNRPVKDGQTDWFDIEMWGKQAEIAGEYVKKGTLVGIEGKIRWDSWNRKDTGELQIKPIIVADSMRLLSSKKDNNPSSVSQPASEPGF